VSQDQHGRSTAGDQPLSATPAEFDQEFATVAGSSGLRRVWQAASPDLPLEIEPYSFVSVGLLGHVADALGLSPGTTLVDLGCGRDGPGLWLAQTLASAGFAEVRVEARPEWHELFTRVFQVALEFGDPGQDVGLASLQDEARRALPMAQLVDRVVGRATRPGPRPEGQASLENAPGTGAVHG
jgi:hypothetical protein